MTACKLNRRNFLKYSGMAVAALGFGTSISSAEPLRRLDKLDKKPNIILFLTDDQGWADTSVCMMKNRTDSRSSFCRTPALEQMAKQGIVFSNGYSPAPQCAPTRGSIQFGKTPVRLGQTTNHPRHLEDRSHLKAIPEFIKSADPDYITAHFGKWMVAKISPEQAGYDESDGTTANGGQHKYSDGSPFPENDPKQIFSVSERANDFMERQVNEGRPFFLQVSHYAVHVRAMARPETIAKTRQRYHSVFPEKKPGKNADAEILYASMVEDLDTGLGMILDKVKKLGIAESTYVIFTSDNGGYFGGTQPNKPLRGGKRWLLEGGIRVPFVVSGPNVLKNSYCDVPAVGWDFLPTFYDLVVGQKNLPNDLDGGSLKEVFEKGNEGTVKRRTKELIFQFLMWEGKNNDPVPPAAAIRDGDYKLYLDYLTKKTALYDVAKDIEESKDLTDAMPEKKAQLHKRLLAYLDEVDADPYWIHRKDGKGNVIGNLGLEEELKKYQ